MAKEKKNNTKNENVPEKTGAKIVIDTLLENGVKDCFGYPGGAILRVYDTIFHTSELKHYLVRHEQGAVHAAEGYARATGKLGVLITTSGPGATNIMTGLADAKMDSTPILAITGQVGTYEIGTDAFQEVDTYGMTIPITKYNALLKSPDDAARVTKEAIAVALSGRPGPSLIDFPKDVQNGLSSNYKDVKMRIPAFHVEKPEISGSVDEIINAINRSAKPVLYVGGGAVISNASRNIIELAEKAQIPVVSTLTGLGAFPGDHKLSLGMLGMHGTAYANKAVMECDFILSLGARFDDRVATNTEDFAKNAIKAQIDIDSAEIEKRVNVDFFISGDLNDVLQKINPQIESVSKSPWAEHVQKLKIAHPLAFDEGGSEIKPQQLIYELWKKTKGEAVIVTDVGQHQMWTAQFYPVKHPRQFICSSGLGTMGYGLPAAIGAKVGVPDKDVILISGDGSIQMNIQELGTAKMYNIPVKIILFNNGYLGMVRQWQELFFEERYSHSTMSGNPDFIKLAAAYDIPGKTIVSKKEIEEGLSFLLSSKGPCLLEVSIPWEEKVFPMIPAGRNYENMIEYEHKKDKGSLVSIIPHNPQK
ncbi:MAG: biosynthetic-type acetolactate synthase large subunit [Spirochaetia bacterium]|nr:biosynthetic-type acetolactate synthase large subunit [Spirochaetia bacterium]